MKIKLALFIYSCSVLFVLYPSFTQAANNIPMPDRPRTANFTEDKVCTTDTEGCFGLTEFGGFKKATKCSIWWGHLDRQNIPLKANESKRFCVRHIDAYACTDDPKEWPDPDPSKGRWYFRARQRDLTDCK